MGRVAEAFITSTPSTVLICCFPLPSDSPPFKKMYNSLLAAALATTSVTAQRIEYFERLSHNADLEHIPPPSFTTLPSLRRTPTSPFVWPETTPTTPLAQYIAHALTTLTADITSSAPVECTETETVQEIIDVTVTACLSDTSYLTAQHTNTWPGPTSTAPPLPSDTAISSCQLPTTPISNEQQVGDSVLGTHCQTTLPKWLPQPDGSKYQSAPWGDKTPRLFDATINDHIPITNVTRKYEFTISRGTISPDGVRRDVILVNGQYPGPAIEANVCEGRCIDLTRKTADLE